MESGSKIICSIFHPVVIQMIVHCIHEHVDLCECANLDCLQKKPRNFVDVIGGEHHYFHVIVV